MPIISDYSNKLCLHGDMYPSCLVLSLHNRRLICCIELPLSLLYISQNHEIIFSLCLFYVSFRHRAHFLIDVVAGLLSRDVYKGIPDFIVAAPNDRSRLKMKTEQQGSICQRAGGMNNADDTMKSKKQE